jgi:hypothetical protein
MLPPGRRLQVNVFFDLIFAGSPTKTSVASAVTVSLLKSRCGTLSTSSMAVITGWR